SALVLDHQMLKKALVLVAFAAILLFVVAGLAAAQRRFKQVRFYIIAWSGAVISSAIMTGRHWFGIDISQEVQFNSMRIVMVSDAALMGLAIWDHFSQLRQARQRALQDSLRHAQQNLQLSRRLELLEQQYALAKRLSERQERRIADTIHDLSQPLHALRLNVGNLGTDGADAAGRQRIEETFAYLETLVAGHLDRSTASADIDDAKEPAEDGADTLGVGAVLRGVFEMFEPDARAKGLRFRHVETSAEAVCEPLALMRIATNLVANAIKYTERGGVLLGCRRVGGVLRVEVHDSGPGLTPQEFERARQRATRLDRDARRADGKGLGLSIAQELAQSRGYALTLDPRRRTGTGLRLDLPRARGRRSLPLPAGGERVGVRG
ncbi:MAG: sensor histidine kinase, partial [Reyranellaceae bacterium]